MFECLPFNAIMGRKTVLSVILCLCVTTTSLYCHLLKTATWNPECMRNQYNPETEDPGLDNKETPNSIKKYLHPLL